MNYIFRYIFAREVYRKYSQHRSGILSVFNFETLGKISWSILFLFAWVGVTWAFSNKNKVFDTYINQGEKLYINKWKSYYQDELPIYQYANEVDPYKAADNPNKSDKKFYYLSTVKINDDLRGKLLGTAKNQIINNDQGSFVAIELDKTIVADKPNWDDLLAGVNTEELSPDIFINTEDIMLADTPVPENRWPLHFIAGLFAVICTVNIYPAFIRLFKRKVPIYEKQAVYKDDKRYKEGERLEGYRWVITGYEPMNKEDLRMHINQQASRLAVYSITFFGLVIYINYLWNS